jgi:hypothetical protein
VTGVAQLAQSLLQRGRSGGWMRTLHLALMSAPCFKSRAATAVRLIFTAPISGVPPCATGDRRWEPRKAAAARAGAAACRRACVWSGIDGALRLWQQHGCWSSVLRLWAAPSACDTARVGRWRGHPILFGIDIGTHGEELVDEAEPAAVRCHVERGLAILRREAEARRSWKGEAGVRGEHEAGTGLQVVETHS